MAAGVPIVEGRPASRGCVRPSRMALATAPPITAPPSPTHAQDHRFDGGGTRSRSEATETLVWGSSFASGIVGAAAIAGDAGSRGATGCPAELLSIDSMRRARAWSIGPARSDTH
jgi:hypothetical protein